MDGYRMTTKISLEYIKTYESNFKLIDNNNRVDYRNKYSEVMSPLRSTFYIYEFPAILIDNLENNVSKDVIKWRKATKKDKLLYIEALEELKRYSMELMKTIQTYEDRDISIVIGLIKAYECMLNSSSLFSKAIDYIHHLERLQ